MKFGSLNEIQPGPGPWEPGHEKRLYDEVLEQAVLTDRLGFDYIWLTEHHFLPGWSLSAAPEVVLGWLAGQTSQIRIGHGVVQGNPPTNHVLRIAERAAVCDILSGGRIDIGLGRALVSVELDAFGMDAADTRPAQEEIIEILPRLWTQEKFSWDGKYYQIPELELVPKPIQSPHPPLWMAANQPASFMVAAERGLGVLAFGFGKPQSLAEPAAAYHAAVVNAQTPSGMINNQVAAAVPAFCAETDDEAFEIFGPQIEIFFRYTAEFMGQYKDTTVDTYGFYRELANKSLVEIPELPASETRGLSPAAAMAKAGARAGFFCVGSPQTCIDYIKSWESTGVDQLIFISQMGKVPHENLMKSYTLFGEEVLPKFRNGAV